MTPGEVRAIVAGGESENEQSTSTVVDHLQIVGQFGLVELRRSGRGAR